MAKAVVQIQNLQKNLGNFRHSKILRLMFIQVRYLASLVQTVLVNQQQFGCYWES